MQITRQQCQQIANGWRGQLSIAVDDIVKPARMRQMIVDFYRHFPDVELIVFRKCSTASGMRWPTAAWSWRLAQRDLFRSGALRVSRYGDAELGLRGGERSSAGEDGGPLSDDVLRNWPSLVREDTSRSLPKRTTWLLDNQKRVVVPDWESSATCLSAGSASAWCRAISPGHGWIAASGPRWRWKIRSRMPPAV
jgi:hypothetical protein